MYCWGIGYEIFVRCPKRAVSSRNISIEVKICLLNWNTSLDSFKLREIGSCRRIYVIKTFGSNIFDLDVVYGFSNYCTRTA